MYNLTVNASKRYQITISDSLREFCATIVPYITGKVAIITDSNVHRIYGNALDGFLRGKTVFKHVVEAGEQSKSKDTYFDLLEQLSFNGFTRTDTIIAFGGGVVGDLAGFVAATYMRGVNLVHVPTTILSAVDSAVGGKTAINLTNGKNLVGCFYQPSAVYVNTEFFRTLPEREIKSGMGEVIKYAFLNDAITPQMIKGSATEQLVCECLKIKRDVVEKDERESNLRLLLNLGHTVGHAIESLSHYSYSHGECVIKGIAYTLKISKALYNLDDQTLAKMQQLLVCCGHDVTCPFGTTQLLKKIALDKKGDGKSIKLVTLKDIGKPQIEKLEYEKLQNLL